MLSCFLWNPALLQPNSRATDPKPGSTVISAFGVMYPPFCPSIKYCSPALCPWLYEQKWTGQSYSVNEGFIRWQTLEDEMSNILCWTPRSNQWWYRIQPFLKYRIAIISCIYLWERFLRRWNVFFRIDHAGDRPLNDKTNALLRPQTTLAQSNESVAKRSHSLEDIQELSIHRIVGGSVDNFWSPTYSWMFRRYLFCRVWQFH